MTKHLTKPIRAIHFLVLAFLMTLSSPVAAQDLREWFNKGTGYYYGFGVPKDYAEAVKWFRLAAEQGYANAQFFLGFLHGEGQGVLQDNVMAHMWYNIASANGDAESAGFRDEIANKMTQQTSQKLKLWHVNV